MSACRITLPLSAEEAFSRSVLVHANVLVPDALEYSPNLYQLTLLLMARHVVCGLKFQHVI